MCFSNYNLKNSTTFNFSLSTFNWSQAGDGGQIARATGGEQRAVEDGGQGLAALQAWQPSPWGEGGIGRLPQAR
jgi:hypothetical protein